MNVERAAKFASGVLKALDDMPFRVGKSRQPDSGVFTMNPVERQRVRNNLKHAIKDLTEDGESD